MGILASVIANGLGGKKGGGSFSPDDFIPKFEPSISKPQDWRDMKAALKGYAENHGK